MKKVIVIGTRPDRTEQFKNCFDSLSGSKHHILKVDCDGYEIGKIKWVLDHTDIDEFVFLQDSVEIKDNSVFDICFSTTHSVSICDYPNPFGCYLGKYKRSVLEKIDLPDIKTKKESIDYERHFFIDYTRYEKLDQVGGSLANVENYVEKWGHKVMKIENEYLIKYKSIWNRFMICE